MKKRNFILFIVLLYFSKILNAAPISESIAKKVALNFLRTKTSSVILINAKSVKLIYKYCDSVTTYIYVFNVNPIGFIVISGDNYYPPKETIEGKKKNILSRMTFYLVLIVFQKICRFI